MGVCSQTNMRDANLAVKDYIVNHLATSRFYLALLKRPISRHFAGRLEDLRKACAELTGRPFQAEISADLVMRFDALPKVPVLMVFNDQDEDFQAHCSLLFERRAEKYLDMECLAISGWALSEWLKQRASK